MLSSKPDPSSSSASRTELAVPTSSVPSHAHPLLDRIWYAIILPRIVRHYFFTEEQECKKKEREEAQETLHQRHYDQMLRDLEYAYDLPPRDHADAFDKQNVVTAPSGSVIIPIGTGRPDEVTKRDEAQWHDTEAHAKTDMYNGGAFESQAKLGVPMKRGVPLTFKTRTEQTRELHELRTAIENDRRFQEKIAKSGEYPEPTRKQRRKASKRFMRRLMAEFLGSFLTVFAIAGMAIAYGLGHVDRTGQAIGDGLSLMVAVYAFGGISGAHLNPIISLAFAMRHVLPWIWVPFYLVAQFAGSMVAAAALYAFFPTSSMGTTTIGDGYTVVTAFLMEAVLSMFLVLTVLLTATRGAVVGAQAALPVGGILTFDILIGAAVTGSGVNWFRSYCPALVSGPHDSSLWVYFVGQTIGMLVAVAFLMRLAGRPTPGETVGAHGMGKSKA